MLRCLEDRWWVCACSLLQSGLDEIAVGAIMGVNERAVKSRLHRARLFVRRELSARGITHHDGHKPGSLHS